MGKQVTWEILWEHRSIIYKELKRVSFKGPWEDIISDVLLKCYKSRDSYDSKYSLTTWLTIITRRYAYDCFRKSQIGKRKAAYLQQEHARQISGYRDPPIFETSELLPECPEMLQLVERGLSQKQIAELLGSPLGTIKSRVHNLRRKLEKTLKEVNS